MLPSSTVENYLKAIYQGQSTLVRDQRLVPMGQVASALGVTPGTATTMVKALAESGLAEYEPYSGVRLNAALAGRVNMLIRAEPTLGAQAVPQQRRRAMDGGDISRNAVCAPRRRATGPLSDRSRAHRPAR